MIMYIYSTHSITAWYHYVEWNTNLGRLWIQKFETKNTRWWAGKLYDLINYTVFNIIYSAWIFKKLQINLRTRTKVPLCYQSVKVNKPWSSARITKVNDKIYQNVVMVYDVRRSIFLIQNKMEISWQIQPYRLHFLKKVSWLKGEGEHD